MHRIDHVIMFLDHLVLLMAKFGCYTHTQLMQGRRSGEGGGDGGHIPLNLLRVGINPPPPSPFYRRKVKSEKIHVYQGRIQEFLAGGAHGGKEIGRGSTPLFFSKFWANLGLILTYFFGAGGARAPFLPPLDPPLYIAFFFTIVLLRNVIF